MSTTNVINATDVSKFKDEDFFIVIMPTYSGNAPIDTMQVVPDLVAKLGKPYRWIEASRITGVATAKNVMFEIARQQTHMNFFRGLILEDDIVMSYDAVPEIVAAIKYAEAQTPKLNLVTNIWVPGIGWSIFHKNIDPETGRVKMKAYSDQELTDLPQYGQVDSSGIGFYYGDIYADYQWHDGTCKHCTNPECMVGQDFAYYNDNNIKLSFFKLNQKHRLLHRKVQDV